MVPFMSFIRMIFQFRQHSIVMTLTRKTTKKRSINSDTTSNKRSKQDQDRYITLQKSDNDKNYSFKLEVR